MFFRTLESHAERPALILADGHRISHAELARRSDDFGRQLGPVPGLLAIEMRSEPEAIAAYLGALRAGHPAILVAEGSIDEDNAILRTFQPERVYCRRGQAWRLEERQPAGRDGVLHPELGALLSTSGTTGSPKLVKLSRANLHENARSIVDYLGITLERRAVTNLPLHYSYGLSVLNSHLLAGGSIVLTDHSVIEREFWELVGREEVTDIPGVPYTYELFEKSGLRAEPPRSLRVLTQAGGRLPPELVRTYATFARERGIRFFVMYGQTEATARMAYLPPEHTLAHADCIGVAIPRGRFEIRDDRGVAITAPGTSGELVYCGPNVMMGYATERHELAAGPALEELRTGDIAQWTEAGFVRIVGRASRFSKIAGLRIGFDDVERILREAGHRAYVAGNDTFIAVALTDGADPETCRTLISARCHLPVRHVVAFRVDEVPTLPSGKIDYLGIRTRGATLHAEEQARAASGDDPIRTLYGHALGVTQVSDSASFSSLGGDSLSYLEVSRGLESILGTLPHHWERITVGELNQLRAETPPAGTSVPAARSTTLSIDVFLRLAAISLVFIGHGAPDHTGWLRGGTGILFCLAGYSLCRFQREQILSGHVLPALTGFLRRVIVPYWCVMTALIVVTHMAPRPAWWTMSSVFLVPRDQREVIFSYWFIETLLHCLLVTCLLFLIPGVRRWARQRPFQTGAVGVGLAISIFLVADRLFGTDQISLTLDGWLYAYLIGWTLPLATRARQRIALILAAGATAVVQFGYDSSRPYWLVAALVVLALVTHVRVPAWVGGLIARIAAATYISYLVHPIITHFTKHVLPTRENVGITIALTYFGTLAAGFVGTALWQFLSDRIVAMAARKPGAKRASL